MKTLYSLEDFRKWAETKDPNTPYTTGCFKSCVMTMFAREMGHGDHATSRIANYPNISLRNGNEDTKDFLPGICWSHVVGRPLTYGALVRRLKDAGH